MRMLEKKYGLMIMDLDDYIDVKMLGTSSYLFKNHSSRSLSCTVRRHPWISGQTIFPFVSSFCGDDAGKSNSNKYISDRC